MVRAMDEMVLRSMAKWPDVPDVYGWLSLDRRGNWLIKGEKIGNAALKDFISRNYTSDSPGPLVFPEWSTARFRGACLRAAGAAFRWRSAF